MGAVLGCYSGPEPDVDALLATRALNGVHGARQQRQPLRRSCSYPKPRAMALPAADAAEDGVLGKLQRTLSRSLLRGLADASGSDKKDSAGRDDDDVRSSSQSYSSASGTSGSRLLSDFYNLVLESERNTFFKDKHGKRVTGAYLEDVRIIDDYFGPIARKRPRAEPKLPILERFAHLPPALMSATSTISSEMDYWSCLDSLALDPDELEKAPRRYDAASGPQLLLLLSPLRSGDASAAPGGRQSRSLSPPSWWPGVGSLQFNEDDDDDDDDDDNDDADNEGVGSRSAVAYTREQLTRSDAPRSLPHLPKPLASPLSSSSSLAATTRSSRPAPSIYSSTRGAAADTAVAPVMAS
ncbi:hypothetical protein PybrP1_001987 [[Pythium] brassicae (nom. inval.)]|nr:hypothetical protein PybrP1_001987 [[Pythium] brassicae (nom. inval.)]